MHSETRQSAIKLLRDLGRGKTEPRSPVNGICYELLDRYGREVRNEIMRHVETWDEYSEDYAHPVPGVDGETAQYAFDNRDLWGNDAYGRARRRLCLHLAAQLEDEPRRIGNRRRIGITIGILALAAAVLVWSSESHAFQPQDLPPPTMYEATPQMPWPSYFVPELALNPAYAAGYRDGYATASEMFYYFCADWNNGAFPLMLPNGHKYLFYCDSFKHDDKAESK